MIDIDTPPLSLTRFYTLAEAHRDIHILPDDIIRLGAAGLLRLCVLVPPDRLAATIDYRSVDVRDPSVRQEKLMARTKPDQAAMPILQQEGIHALILTPNQCRELDAFGFTRASLFLKGYGISFATGIAGYSDPAEIAPVRAPLFKADGSSLPQHHSRFAMYPVGQRFEFIEQVGYRSPDELLLTNENIRILGRELDRLPKTLDVTPEVQAREPSSTGTSHAVTPHTDDPESNAPQAPDQAQATAKGRKSRKPPKERAVGGPDTIILLERAEVERRTRLSRSVIYDRLNKKSPRHDPAFPRPINIGNRSVGWIEAEVDAWIKEQVETSRK